MLNSPFFFFLTFISFIYLFILLYNIVLVLPYIDMNLPWVYMCSPSWTSLPPPSPSHPSGSSQCTSPKHPASCIEPGLAIHFTYDNIHVSMPFFHIIPPSPSLTESKRLFYTSVSLLLSPTQTLMWPDHLDLEFNPAANLGCLEQLKGIFRREAGFSWRLTLGFGLVEFR